MSLDSTAGGASANAYLTVAEADTYFNDRLHADDWKSAAADVKEDAILTATAVMDAFFEWDGGKATTTQRLRWPRSGATTRDGESIDSTTIPEVLQWATAELAKSYIQRDRMKDPDALGHGVKSFGLGDDQIEVRMDRDDVLSFVPKYILISLGEIGELLPDASRGAGFRVIKVERA